MTNTTSIQATFDDRFEVSLDELAKLTGFHPDLILRIVETGALDPPRREGEVAFFTISAVARIRAFQRIRRDLGANFEGACVILELVKRIELLETELKWLRNSSV